MAGSSSNIPVSDSLSPSFLEALYYDSQFDLLADIPANAPFSFSSLFSSNPLETNTPPSAPMINVSTSPPRFEVPLPSPRVQESTPVDTNIDISEAGPSRRPVKRCRNMAELMEPSEPVQPRDPAPSMPETTADPAPSQAKTTNPFSCGCCHVLREIIHTNGLQYQKLEVHGMIGLIHHAVYHQDVLGGSSKPQMFDFGNKNIEEIKHFLVGYCLNQNSLGYELVPDPLSTYYEALCVGLDWTRTQNKLLGSSLPINAENISSKGKEPEVVNSQQDDYSGLKLSDTYRANKELRKRRDSMSLIDLSNYFHLTLDEASKQLNLSARSITMICRREKLDEWPYKKLQKLTKYLSVLRERLSQEDPITRVITRGEIGRVQNEMVQVCGGVVPLVAYLI